MTDPEGNTTSFAYDDNGNLTEETITVDGTPLARQHTYDVRGNRTRSVDRNETVRDFEYDPLGRLRKEIWYENTTTAAAGTPKLNTIEWTYDPFGRLTRVWDDFSDYEYQYDALDRLIEEEVDNFGTAVTLTTAYGTRNDGLRTSFSANIDGTDDFSNAYAYDDRGLLTQVTQQSQTGGNAVAPKRVDIDYDLAGRFSTIERYADLTETYEVATGTHKFDALGRLYDLTYTDNLDATIRQHQWTYNRRGETTSYYNDYDLTANYDYDGNGQVTSNSLTSEDFQYDANGNRVTVDADDYETGDHNRLLKDGTFRYEYDKEGNIVARYVDGNNDDELDAGDSSITTFEYDNRNRLVGVKQYTGTGYDTLASEVDYVYDALNRRIGRHEDSDGDADIDQSQWHVYDQTDVILDFLDTDGHDDSDPEDASPALSKRYLWGPAVDQLFAQERFATGAAADVDWTLTDKQGTVRDLAQFNTATSTTSIATHYTYDTFGNVTKTGTADTRYRYTAQEYDLTTGLYYCDARWYDPALGRFVSLDPIGFDAGDANLYRYVGNGPANATDPTGLEPVSKAATKKITKAIIKKLVSERLLQLHHIIQQKLFKPTTAMGRWLGGLAGKHATENVIYLPTLKSGGKKAAIKAAERIAAGEPVSAAQRALAKFAQRTGHQGCHLRTYLIDTEARLVKIMASHQAKAIDDAAAKAEIAAIQAEIREGLESGFIILQKVEQYQLKAGATISVGGLAVISSMSKANWDAKVEKLEAYVEELIQPRMMKGMRVEDHAPALAILDWVNPLDLYASAEEAGYAASLTKPEGVRLIEAKMAELGLLPPPEQIVHMKTIAMITETYFQSGKWCSQEEESYVDSCLKRPDIIMEQNKNKGFIRIGAKVDGQWWWKKVKTR